jgi:signal peptidase I
LAEHRQEKKRASKQSDKKIWLLYVLLLVLVLAYAFWNNVIIGVLAFLVFVATLFIEFRSSVKSVGAKQSAYDVGLAICAIVVLWIILIFILQTSAPVDVVASCSMLPNLQRGDLIILHGIGNMSSFLKSSHVPVINVSQQSFKDTIENIESEWNVYLPYYHNNTNNITLLGADPFSPFIIHQSNYSVGLYNWKCIVDFEYYGYNQYSKCYVSQQNSSLVGYNYSVLGLQGSNGTAEKLVTTSSTIVIANTIISENYSNPIIVYSTTAEDSYPLEHVIHRLVAVIKSGGNYYLLTRGDNNPYLDLQVANYPVNQSNVVGYVVARVPILGYVKLIISGQLSSVAGCNQTIQL